MKAFFAGAALLALAGCVATPYQESGFLGGSGVQQLREDIWRIKYSGNGFTTRESVQTYWLYRSATLTLEKGYDGFEVLSQIPFVRSPDLIDGYAGEGFFVRTAQPVYIPIYTETGSSHPIIEGDIRLIKKPFQPSPPKVFDAATLKAALDKFVNGPKCDVAETTGNVCPHVHDYLQPKGKL